MKIHKGLFWVTLVAGLTFFSIGVYLKITNQYSNGYTSGRFGNIHHGMITGFGAMFLGVLLLLSSIWTFRMYKEEKEKFDKME